MNTTYGQSVGNDPSLKIDIAADLFDDDDDIPSELVETLEKVTEELEDVERALAKQLNLRGPHVRKLLITLDRQNLLDEEEELVSQWHHRYAAYSDWLKPKTEAPPPTEEPEFRARELAATAAFSFLWPWRRLMNADGTSSPAN